MGEAEGVRFGPVLAGARMAGNAARARNTKERKPWYPSIGRKGRDAGRAVPSARTDDAERHLKGNAGYPHTELLRRSERFIVHRADVCAFGDEKLYSHSLNAKTGLKGFLVRPRRVARCLHKAAAEPRSEEGVLTLPAPACVW